MTLKPWDEREPILNALARCGLRATRRPAPVVRSGLGRNRRSRAGPARCPYILPKLRVYYIGGPNKKWGPDAYQYIATHHPKLWIIEANATYRGWFSGGEQLGEWCNREFVNQHIAGHGALGDFFASKLDAIKMGDTPSVAWLPKGTPTDPTQPSWGGPFVRASDRPNSVFNRLTTEEDRIHVFDVLELVIPLGDGAPEKPEARLLVQNQSLIGHAPGDRTMRFRFCPKAASTYRFTVYSNAPSLNGKKGGIMAVAPSADDAKQPSRTHPNWWTDDPAAEFAESEHRGARTISRWRTGYLRNFADRMNRAIRNM